MSAPRTKRPFAGASSDPAQRQITSFFGPRSQQNPAAQSSALATPTLPAHVQANLLSVGMRVRKSVPEGYKTGREYSGFKLWADRNDVSSGGVGGLRVDTGAGASSQRELLPFCGIHRVGGLDTQSPFYDEGCEDPFADFRPLAVPGVDDVPGLTSSQESNGSGISNISRPSMAGTRKRSFEEDSDRAEAPVRVWQDREDWLNGEVSPRSLAPTGWGNARAMAVPRKHRLKGAAIAAGAAAAVGYDWPVGQENMVDDFEEAQFLDYRAMDMSDG